MSCDQLPDVVVAETSVVTPVVALVVVVAVGE